MKKVSTTILAFTLLLSANSFGQDFLKNLPEKTEKFHKTFMEIWLPKGILILLGLSILIGAYFYFIKSNLSVTRAMLIITLILLFALVAVW